MQKWIWLIGAVVVIALLFALLWPKTTAVQTETPYGQSVKPQTETTRPNTTYSPPLTQTTTTTPPPVATTSPFTATTPPPAATTQAATAPTTSAWEITVNVTYPTLHLSNIYHFYYVNGELYAFDKEWEYVGRVVSIEIKNSTKEIPLWANVVVTATPYNGPNPTPNMTRVNVTTYAVYSAATNTVSYRIVLNVPASQIYWALLSLCDELFTNHTVTRGLRRVVVTLPFAKVETEFEIINATEVTGLNNARLIGLYVVPGLKLTGMDSLTWGNLCQVGRGGWKIGG